LPQPARCWRANRSGDARLVCITTSGAGGALLADHAAERNLPLAGDASGEWQGDAGAAIGRMPARGHLRNPIDLGSLADWGDLDQILQMLKRDDFSLNRIGIPKSGWF
jgi:acyl-CoA synthetase (NDP forming)